MSFLIPLNQISYCVPDQQRPQDSSFSPRPLGPELALLPAPSNVAPITTQPENSTSQYALVFQMTSLHTTFEGMKHKEKGGVFFSRHHLNAYTCDAPVESIRISLACPGQDKPP